MCPKEDEKQPKIVLPGIRTKRRSWRARLDPRFRELFESFTKVTPPIGKGHIDRYYFTNATETVQVNTVQATAYDANGQPHPLTPIDMVPPMTARSGGHVGESMQTYKVEIFADISHDGIDRQVAYTCTLDPMIFSETISSVVVGLQTHWVRLADDQEVEILVPYGVVIGYQGAQALVTDIQVFPPID